MRTVLIADQISNGCAAMPHEPVAAPVIAIEDGVISEVSARAEFTMRPGDEVLDFPGCTLLPAFFDVHIHGCAGHDVMEGTAASFETVGRFLATHGVGAFLATTVTASMDDTLRALGEMAQLMARPTEGTRAVGIHLEGPFLSHVKRGVHPPELLQAPSVEKFDRLWQASEGHIRLMTIAPELPEAAEVIARAVSVGVRVSLGHSDATAAQTRTGIDAGATSATHTFNAMRALNHRESGIAGVVLDDDSLFAEIICDGLHVAPEMVRLFWNAKGPERAMLVTDAMSATGMPDGVYKLGGLDVEVSGGVCRLDGALAGSTLTMDRAIRNFREFTGASLETVGTLAARNPARMTGLDDRIGSIAVGRDADVVVLSDGGEVVATLVNGRIAFRA
ncbi:MAG TPA: N-acetylglucosamine-6-phosphate deacetylase [Acidisarcina sp.]